MSNLFAERFETVRTLAKSLRNKETPLTLEELRKYSSHIDTAVLATVLDAPCDSSAAQHLHIIADKIAIDALLNGDYNRVLRSAVAGSLWVSPRYLHGIYNETDWLVCMQFVNNPNCPRDLLEKLAELPTPKTDSGVGEAFDRNKIIRDIARRRVSEQTPKSPQ